MDWALDADRLGAAERKIVRDLLMDEMRLRLLEDIVWNELRHARAREACASIACRSRQWPTGS